MNLVTLTKHHQDPSSGETAYLVETLLPGDNAFPGPAGMDWTQFEAISGDEASFVWRTGAQRFLALAEAASGGELDAAEASRSFLVRRFLDAKLACLEYFEDEELPGDEEELEGWLLERAAEHPEELLGTEGPLAFYSSESDEYLHDAARTLPLPPWARYELGAAGGMASGYDEPLIVLAGGKDLLDLARWLQGEPAVTDPLWASLPFDLPFLPNLTGDPRTLRIEPAGADSLSAQVAPTILRIHEDYVQIEARGWLSEERYLAGPLKGPAGLALARLSEDALAGRVRIQQTLG